MTLEIQKEADRVAIFVDGKCVWRGTISEWSKAISHPIGWRRDAA